MQRGSKGEHTQNQQRPGSQPHISIKTRIGSFDSVVQAKTPSTAYATSARTNFFLIVTQSQVSSFRGFKVRSRHLDSLKP